MKNIHKVKYKNGLPLILILIVGLSGCVSRESTINAASTQTQLPSPTSNLRTSTPIPQPVQTATRMPPATLVPEQAKDTIRGLLRETTNCPVPCFWGIIPGQTMLSDAEENFAYLGLQLKHTYTQNNEDFYALIYDLDGGLRVSPVLSVQDNIVKSIKVGINPEKLQEGVSRQWLAYSPETLINLYGAPSKVEFFVGRGAPSISYAMYLYFDTVDLIVEYYSYDITFETTSFRVCPLTDQIFSVGVWMGQDPQHPPLDAVPLTEATTMTMEEFVKLMKGNPNNACIDLKEEVFH